MTTQATPRPWWTLALRAAASLVNDPLKTPPTSVPTASAESRHGGPNIPVSEVLTTIRVIARLIGRLGPGTAAQPSSVGIPSRSKRMAGQPWSPAHEGVLIARSEEGMTIQQVAILLERSDGAIRSRLRMINYTPHGPAEL